jgi:hypothetical protein
MGDQTPVPPVLRGDFCGPQNCHYLLIREDRIRMSLSPVEFESLAPHSRACAGVS